MSDEDPTPPIAGEAELFDLVLDFETTFAAKADALGLSNEDLTRIEERYGGQRGLGATFAHFAHHALVKRKLSELAALMPDGVESMSYKGLAELARRRGRA